MADSIERLLAEAVRTAVQQSVQDIAPAVAVALRDAGSAQGSGVAVVYVTVKEAARVMSAHPSTVRKLVADGHLGKYLLAGQLRVKVSDIHAYMARETGGSPRIDLDERAIELLARGNRRG